MHISAKNFFFKYLCISKNQINVFHLLFEGVFDDTMKQTTTTPRSTTQSSTGKSMKQLYLNGKKSRSEIVLLNNLPQSLLITVRITLVNSDVPSRGRIQLWYKGEKGSICDDDFDEKDATVVCQMFGYRYGY